MTFDCTLAHQPRLKKNGALGHSFLIFLGNGRTQTPIRQNSHEKLLPHNIASQPVQ